MPPAPWRIVNDPLSVVGTNAQTMLRGMLAQLPNLAVAIVVFILFVVIAKFVRGLFRGAGRRLDRSLAHMLGQLAYAAILALGVLAALWISIPTVQFTEIFTSLGVTGLILGFALRDILENFVAGILILWRRPFRVGDQIRSGKFEGTVEEVNFRSTVMRSYDGIRVFIPNGKVLTEPVENLTAYHRRRTTVALGIDQNASVQEARQVILRSLRDAPGVLHDPEPLVLFDAIGDFTNDLK
ncbi:MAG TPA: mechanosensitive ion channel, partial [Chloroflexota bacterium]|nr:mechanosensitive ion channel [Chloroflexota bacterium]